MGHDILIFAEALIFIYASFLAGRIFLRFIFILPRGIFSKNIFTALIGLGIFGIAGLIFALFGIFSAFVLRTFGLVILFSSAGFIRDDLNRFRGYRVFAASFRQWFAKDFYFKLILIIWLFANVFIVFVPITGNDTLQYHEPIMQDLVATSRIDYKGTSHTIFGVLAFAEILYTMPRVVFGNTSAPFVFQVLQYAALIFLLMLVYGFVKKRTNYPFLALALPFLILALFDLQREVFHAGYIDIFIILFGITSTLVIIDMFDGPKAPLRHIVLSALLIGFALGMKYSALFFLAPNGLILLIFLIRRHMGAMQKISYLFLYGGIVSFISGYWYIKNIIFFGNPFYPIFSVQEADVEVGVFVVGKNIINFFLFPFVRYGTVSATDSSSKLIIVGFFAALYVVMLVFIFFRRKALGSIEYLLFAFIHIYMWMMFFNSHQTRFLLPAIIMVPVLLILLSDKLLHAVEQNVSRAVFASLARIMRMACIALFLLLFIGNVHYFYVKFLYKTGFYSKSDYTVIIGGQ